MLFARVYILVPLIVVHAVDYVLNTANTDTCPSGSESVQSQAECFAAKDDSDIVFSMGEILATASFTDRPTGCFFNGGAILTWNVAPTGTADFSCQPVCKAISPTPAPTNPTPPSPAPTSPAPLGMSGDPILRINGHRVKFDMPSRSLMWGDGVIEVFAAADLTTPDKRSQWFSDFTMFVHGKKVALVQRKEIQVNSKESPRQLNSLSLTTFDREVATAIASLGSYQVGNGAMRIQVKRDGGKVGPLRKEVVAVSASSIAFSLSPERAKKFAKNETMALKYVHLDLAVQRMEASVQGGILAEMYGFIPMTKKTASLLRSFKM